MDVDVDETTGAEKDSFWRSLIKDRKPSSKVVKPSELAKKHFDRSLGVLNPKQIVDLVESVDDVNAPFFWELLRLGRYEGQEQQQRLLYGKMAVRTKRFGSEVTRTLEENCMLADPVPVKDALEAIGCYIAVDAVPPSIADNTPRHVAQHVQWLKSKGMLTVDKANARQRNALGEHFLKESLDVEVLKVFAELPIFSLGDSYVPLKGFCGLVKQDPRALRPPGIVGNKPLAEACRRSGLQAGDGKVEAAQSESKKHMKELVRFVRPTLGFQSSSSTIL